MKPGEVSSFQILKTTKGEFWLTVPEEQQSNIAGLRSVIVLKSEVYSSRRSLMTRIGQILDG